MQKANRLKAQTFGSNRETANRLFSTVKTDPKGRYISQGLQPGVYR
jgi:hypothetical protein